MKKKDLSVLDIIEIIHLVLVTYETQANVAKQFRVSKRVVQKLVKNVRTNKNFLQEILYQRENTILTKQSIQKVVEYMILKDEIIDSV